MQAKARSPLLLACLLAGSSSLLPTFAGAAPQQDPARIDGGHQVDPANVFGPSAPARGRASSIADTARNLVPDRAGGTVDRVVQQAGTMADKFPSFGMRGLSGDDYRAAYGNANVRERMGRTYSSPGASSGQLLRDGQSWFGQWLTPRDGGAYPGSAPAQGGMIDPGTMKRTMDDLGRQLLPLVEDFREGVDRGLQRGNQRR